MRNKETGKSTIEKIIKNLEKNHKKHVRLYGDKLDERLTGIHETCDIDTFRYGNSDRGASIRIPVSTAEKGYGYIEDRRPRANCDPYLVASVILSTICKIKLDQLDKLAS
jgi:glutamine synthetase